MAENGKATSAFLNQVLDEYGPRISIDGGSAVLVSDANIANALYKAVEPIRTPAGPTITVAKRGLPGEEESNIKDINNCNFERADNLKSVLCI